MKSYFLNRTLKKKLTSERVGHFFRFIGLEGEFNVLYKNNDSEQAH